jgi:hypothetical protein
VVGLALAFAALAVCALLVAAAFARPPAPPAGLRMAGACPAEFRLASIDQACPPGYSRMCSGSIIPLPPTSCSCFCNSPKRPVQEGGGCACR